MKRVTRYSHIDKQTILRMTQKLVEHLHLSTQHIIRPYTYIYINHISIDTESAVLGNCQFPTYAFIRPSDFGL